MEYEPGLEFEFYLAEKVMHCTVEELRERMSMEEFVTWAMYYGRKAQRAELASRQ